MVEYRARFDANKNVQDLMKAKRLLISGEEELKKAMYWHTENFNCKNSTSIILDNESFYLKFLSHLMVLLIVDIQHPMML
jgi:hypothetical protein